ncbi:MAG: class I SAM-dependent methyltransferase [Syntrophobacterales bacterium]|nr:class I SAM-dependent methyltransferase [Syntrophobacterales bacterium]
MGRSRLEFFDREAHRWEEKHYPMEVRKRLEELVLSEFCVVPGTNVLDVGSGTGIIIPLVSNLLGPSGFLCSFDLSFPMIRKAKPKISRDQDGLLCADVHHIPLRSNVFDLVICFAAFPHFDNQELAIQEMARVLKKGGRLIIAHLLSREELARHHASRNEVRGDLLPSDEVFTELAKKAGLQVEKIIERSGCFLFRAIKVA